MVKKLVIFGMILFMVLGMLGCSAKPAEDEAKREVNATEIKEEGRKKDIPQLTLEEAFQKIKDKENFVFIVTQSTCSYCNSFKKTLTPFLKEYEEIPFYEIEVDMLGDMKADTDKNFKTLQKKIPDFTGGTPAMFCYEKGRIKKSASGELSEAALMNFMIDCGYLKGEKRKEEQAEDYTFQTSKKIENKNLIEVTKKIDNKDTFYLMITQSDRYNQAFIEKLIPVLEENNSKILALHFPLEQKGTDDEMNKAFKVLMNCIKDLNITPAVFRINKGLAEKLMEDNVSLKDIKNAFDKK